MFIFITLFRFGIHYNHASFVSQYLFQALPVSSKQRFFLTPKPKFVLFWFHVIVNIIFAQCF